MNSLEQAFLSGRTVLTAEITPPKGAGIKKLLERANLVRPFVDALNITDCQRSLVRMSSLAASRVLLDHGMEPVFQLTCRDRNQIALQADLLGASALGIRNLLCLTGDPVKVGDHPDAKSVFELEALGLIRLTQKLQSGTDGGGNKLNAKTKFFIGAVVNPTLHSGAHQLERLQKKALAGARFFQTQANYDLGDLVAFLRLAHLYRDRILVGILLLQSFEMADFIAKNIPGIRIPQHVLDRLRQSQNPHETALELGHELMLACSGLCAGFHLMTIRAEELLPRLVERYACKITPDPILQPTPEAWG